MDFQSKEWYFLLFVRLILLKNKCIDIYSTYFEIQEFQYFLHQNLPRHDTRDLCEDELETWYGFLIRSSVDWFLWHLPISLLVQIITRNKGLQNIQIIKILEAIPGYNIINFVVFQIIK